MDKGFIMLSRKFFSNEMWEAARTFSECEAWLDLIQSARFDATRLTASIGGREITYGRGQYPASVRFLSKRWRWGEQKVRSFIEKLIKKGMVTTDNSQGMTVITLVKYDDYNINNTVNNTQDNTSNVLDYNRIKEFVTQAVTQQITQLQHSDNTKKNKENKEKNIGDSDESLVCGASQPHTEHIDYSELVKFFNEETKGVFGTVRTPLSDSRKGMINARIKSYGKKTFADMIRKAYQSDFLKGQNKKGWTASFDWLIKPTNFEKVISGNYDNNNSRNYPAIPNGAKSREEQTDREILEYAAKAFGKGMVSSK